MRPRSVDACRDPRSASPRPVRPLLPFFLLVFGLAIPFWVAGAITGLQLLPGLPLAALTAICPGIAALLCAYRESGTGGAWAVLARLFDYGRIKAKIWYPPIVLLYPCVLAVSFGWLRWTGTPVPAPQVTVLPTLLLCAGFFAGAAGEELGWSGYALDPLQDRRGALQAALVLGLAWVVFHAVALAEAHRSVAWIAWWSLGTVAARVVIVWLYNNTGRSVFAAALFHTTLNVGWQMFPINGSYWDPRLNGLIMALVAATVAVTAGSHSLVPDRRPDRATPAF